MAPYESDSSEGEDLPGINSNVLFGSPQRQQQKQQPQKPSRKKSSSLPDFLENSPFLPVLRERKQPRKSISAGSTPSANHVPNLNQILRSKRIRFISAVTLAFIIGLLIFAPRQKLNLDILHRQAPYCATPITPRPPLSPPAACADKDINWSRYAYVQYVTTPSYLCNSVMLFEALHRLGSKADRIMMFPSSYIPDLDTAVNLDSVEMRLLWKAKNEYGVKMIPIDIQHKDGDAEWADSYTKLLAFNQTQYERVLSLDSDSTLLQNMDELFLLPSTPVAMPRAYWLSKSKKPGTILSSYVFLVQPSIQEFERIEYAIKMAKKGDYDMEIVNDLYGQSCLVLPHRRYGLLTGEFRADDHLDYMGNGYEVWDPEVALKEAKLVHFSDWPLPKPWLEYSKSEYARSKVKCGKDFNGKEDCRSRDIWLGLYKDFTQRRKNICGPEAHTRDDEWEIGIKME